ncbi:MAG: DNA repair protein RecN [Salibacteraceae bacterium]
MIRKLSINNLALIREAEFELQTGFTAITGESGSGKTVLLKGLDLVLGSRADFTIIRAGEKKCIIEAEFDTYGAQIEKLLADLELDSGETLIVRRELTTDGRSRAFVNDTPVSLGQLREIGQLLVDVHGQHETLQLKTPSNRLELIDAMLSDRGLSKKFKEAYILWKQEHTKLTHLKEQSERADQDRDYLLFQVEELSKINLDPAHRDQLLMEASELENAEEILIQMNVAVQALGTEETGGVDKVKFALQAMRRAESSSSRLADLTGRLESVRIELDDLLSEIESVAAGIEVNPSKLEILKAEIDEQERLMHKHKVNSISELKQIFEELKTKLDTIETIDHNIADLEVKVNEYYDAATDLALKLSEERRKAAEQLQNRAIEVLRTLEMPKAGLKFEINRCEQLSDTGFDTVEIQFNANHEEALKPVSEVASGGELARLMLAIKSVSGGDSADRTQVFDEIDTGVSGETARKIGKLMAQIGAGGQVLAVTHLPGVAACGNHHLRVSKTEVDGEVVSVIQSLHGDERVNELAAMFAGNKVDHAALESARNLLFDD